MSNDTINMQPPVYIPNFDVGNASDLLDQMETAFMRDSMLRHAMEASRFMHSIMTDCVPAQIEEHVDSLMSTSLLRELDQTDAGAMMIGVAAAAVMETARQGAQTAVEKLEGALAILSERYQADW